MSYVLVYRSRRSIYVAVDSIVSSMDGSCNYRIETPRKVFRGSGFLAAHAGPMRVWETVLRVLSGETFDGGDPYLWLRDEVMPKVRTQLKERGNSVAGGDGERSGAIWAVVAGGRIFGVGSYYSVVEHTEPYLGFGGDADTAPTLALSLLHHRCMNEVNDYPIIDDELRLILSLLEHTGDYCAAPFHTESMLLADTRVVLSSNHNSQ